MRRNSILLVSSILGSDTLMDEYSVFYIKRLSLSLLDYLPSLKRGRRGYEPPVLSPFVSSRGGYRRVSRSFGEREREPEIS